MKKLGSPRLLIAIAVCAGACGGDDDDGVTPAEATYASEASLATSTDAAFMYDQGTVSWNAGSKCATIQLMGVLTANERDWAITTDYVRCSGECPKSGSVTLTGATSATLTFDGTPNPAFQTTDGDKGTLALRCGG